jgi:hypothetical protein
MGRIFKPFIKLLLALFRLIPSPDTVGSPSSFHFPFTFSFLLSFLPVFLFPSPVPFYFLSLLFSMILPITFISFLVLLQSIFSPMLSSSDTWL